VKFAIGGDFPPTLTLPHEGGGEELHRLLAPAAGSPPLRGGGAVSGKQRVPWSLAHWVVTKRD